MPPRFFARLVWMALNCSSLLLRALPVLERDEVEGVVGALGKAEQAEAYDGGDGLDAGDLVQRVLHVLRGGGGALQGGALRQLQRDEGVALIFRGQEAARDALAQQQDARAERQQ